MAAAPSIGFWVGSAFAVNCLVTAIIFATRGAGVSGTHIALAATARVSFLLFWMAYTGGALELLFGAAFMPLKRHGRDFGLAFATALVVHLGLVAWLCWIGDAPKVEIFIFFGIAAFFTYTLALFSIGQLQRMLGYRNWSILRIVALNFILYAFLVDFMRNPFDDGILRIARYLPFMILAASLRYYALLR